MTQVAAELIPVTIEDELKQSYLDYAMSVIVGRALPDIRDGLKPVHRRVLFAMDELGNDWNKPHKKSARIVGDVIGKYHPHGDTAVYDTIVRMAQPFSLRYLLVDGQGNFGSVDGDAPAAMRYTEIRMTKMAHELLADLDKETVDFSPNYDGTEQIPVVLPTRVPNLLINGSSGIAVGMATNIPPHNLSEVIKATLAMIDNQAITLPELMQYIPGPDFPTAGIINGKAGILEAYKTGRGRIYVRARTEIEENEKTGKSTILVHELPYQVNKARLLEKIAELVRDKKIEGITALRDESDKSGMRVVIELRRGEQADVVLNNLYRQTQLQTVFGINMVALDKGQPRLVNLTQMLSAFLQHRREVVTRRTIYELRKSRERTHLLEGLTVALENMDPVIALIKASKTPADARDALLARAWPQGNVTDWLQRAAGQTRPDNLDPAYGLKSDGYHFSPEQANAILEMKLHRLTGLESDKLREEYVSLIDLIADLLQILADPDRLHQVIRDELEAILQQFGDKRRTELSESSVDMTLEDLITEEEVVLTLSHAGYVKTQSLDSYSAQHRGGRGKMATVVRDQDFVKSLSVVNTHRQLLCFSSYGKVYWMKPYQVPQAGRASKGRPIVNLLSLAPDESITAILPVSDYNHRHYVFMATEQGVVKKVALSEFERQRNNGKIALELNEGDHLIGVAITDGEQDVMLMSDNGKAIRFSEKDVREMGRTARGVRGMKLGKHQKLIALIIPQEGNSILTATKNGYGQRTRLEDYRAIGRGGQGVIAIQTNDRNGSVVSAAQVSENDHVLLISDQGTMVRTRVNEISVIGRNTQGVRLVQVVPGEHVVGIEAIPADLVSE
jgi:DNA gyrase subunit A